MEVPYFDRKIKTASRDDLVKQQTSRSQMLLNRLLKSNPFYGRRLRDAGLTDTRLLNSLEEKTISFHFVDGEQGD